VFTGIDLDAPRWHSTRSEPQAGQAEEFVEDLEALGPTFVKIGQALSTRPDMVPPAYLVALQRMQDDVSPIPSRPCAGAGGRARRAHQQGLLDFDEMPLGCASLAQVHRARLRDGREVAVKVQRPFVSEIVHADLDTLANVAGKADRVTDIAAASASPIGCTNSARPCWPNWITAPRAREPDAFRRTLRQLSGVVRAAAVRDLSAQRAC
jgi:predicted unusual protein kinase regulating ubiquinone biosynthesis (AarF/ABC1/UbiB family)